MNAVEIEEAVSKLVEEPFNAAEFPYAFLEASSNKTATLQRLRNVGKNSTNKTDVNGDDVQAILQRNNVHMATLNVMSPLAPEERRGEGSGVRGNSDAVADLLKRLIDSPATSKHKAKFALATDGLAVHAASLNSDDPPLVCEFKELADHFGYFLELAGISTVRQIRENAFDIKATGRLNRLYVELLRTNPNWDGDERREELNHFFARLIFCFFAEDTGIFNGNGLFTDTVRQMSDPSGGNTNFVLAEIFRSMDIPMKDRDAAKLRTWAGQFPYVNGGLFGNNSPGSPRPASGRGAGGEGLDNVPKFTQIARSYLLHIGSLDWTQINPDIFGSMIQAVADDGERGALGMHYTSVPNILKVLNPLTNFRGIELRHFAVEVARLALIIAEYQCDELYRGKRLALAEFLPLNKESWITHGNALRLDWLKVCPPTGTGVKLVEDDLFQTPLDQIEIDFENEGGETYICGNPPFTGTRKQSQEQKDDLKHLFESKTKKWKNVDYVGAWFLKAAIFNGVSKAAFAFVATNSICQGQQVPITWQIILKMGLEISFAHTSFKWNNLASHNAGVTVVITGLRSKSNGSRLLFYGDQVVNASYINPYLTPHEVEIIQASKHPRFVDAALEYGVYYSKSDGLIASPDEYRQLRSLGVPRNALQDVLGDDSPSPPTPLPKAGRGEQGRSEGEEMSELILFTSDDGQTQMHLRVEEGTIWLTQAEIAELFQTTKQNVSLHAKNVLEEGELQVAATVKESLTVQNEGSREVKRTIACYNLDLILAIGYRVRSPRGTQFRQWATTHLREFLVKGFVVDDQRLKDPKGWDYFDELLARIREIRASEKRFYQKVREWFAGSQA